MKYAKVSWSIEDIHHDRRVRELDKWTDERAGDFLAENEGSLKDVMIMAGWEAIADSMYNED